MRNLNEKLSEALDIMPLEENQSDKFPVIVKDSIDDDTEFARTNIRNIIEKGNEALDNILKVAVESEHPRAYEVASNFLKNLSEMNKDLLEIHKANKVISKESSSKQTYVDKAVFVGTTADLLKLKKQNNND
jgi:hypothetical protein